MRRTASVLLIAMSTVADISFSSEYERLSFNFESYAAEGLEGSYTGLKCERVNIDHVVSLKDAHDSGAHSWTSEAKEIFANDRKNHLVACRSVNSSKGSAGPKDFLRRSRDGVGIDYKIVNFCGYVDLYYTIKVSYGLSFESNDSEIFGACGIEI